jgi:hypothetical protein
MLTNEEIEHALTLLPCATVARMQTVGHSLHAQEKEPVLLALEAFLNTLEVQGAGPSLFLHIIESGEGRSFSSHLTHEI